MNDLMAAGVQLMLVGMGTVFTFLTVLVFATMLMSYLIGRFAPASLAPAGASGMPGSAKRDEEVAAIAAALHKHRKN